MDIRINEDPACGEPEIVIRCREMDERIVRMIAALRAAEQKLAGVRDGRTFVVDPAEVYYAESVDKRTFLYTADAVYESPLRLYEMEERFGAGDFFRASKSAVVNLARVKSLSPMLGGKIEVLLENNERLMVSRQYVPGLRQKLGI
ncbi:LytTR family transcriptional regulator [Anaerotruncus massiliensis (ex Liu et al. 2021)]|uniref:LytTR family transcriptional regulator n=2 Tax=Anaerotruncus TaxID=244127 RepID=A0A498CQ12_9FIRM|nr:MULTISPECIES: LytTR family DNA-binding domain-containing protein [Anaerotruncus]MBC3938870.1 LytTR family transcriptional regulator DNA-binding domain-containing protein [Anaerotruncus massiliensis (ex Togo et al. 2019)]RLL10826.1 LytTR family transcriptional regulator [Anaerotruncus massiliensis (ex Liu et al. 2021)]